MIQECHTGRIMSVSKNPSGPINTVRPTAVDHVGLRFPRSSISKICSAIPFTLKTIMQWTFARRVVDRHLTTCFHGSDDRHCMEVPSWPCYGQVVGLNPEGKLNLRCQYIKRGIEIYSLSKPYIFQLSFSS